MTYAIYIWLQRLSNLRISVNFNEDLCRKVTKACVRVGEIEFGMPYECVSIIKFDNMHT